MTTAYGGFRRVQPISVVRARARMGDNRQTLRDPPARDPFDSLPSIQNQSLWVKEGEPICLRCHWPINSQGCLANCGEPT
jgi:hypothetical protein